MSTGTCQRGKTGNKKVKLLAFCVRIVLHYFTFCALDCYFVVIIIGKLKRHDPCCHGQHTPEWGIKFQLPGLWTGEMKFNNSIHTFTTKIKPCVYQGTEHWYRFYFRFICQFRLNSEWHSDNHKWSQQVIIWLVAHSWGSHLSMPSFIAHNLQPWLLSFALK